MADWLPKILLDDFELIVMSSEIRTEGLNNLNYHRIHDEKLRYRRDR